MSKFHSLRIPLLVTFIATGSIAQTTVATGQYDTNRTGTNLNETILTPENVNQNSFGKLFAWAVDGRVYAQPLYIPDITVSGRTTNVVYVATQHNSIYAFDAANQSAQPPLWQKSLGPSVPVTNVTHTCPASTAGSELGVYSTPVIDVATGTIYAVSTSPDGKGDGGYNFFINALDIHTGQHKFNSPKQIKISVPGDGYDNVNGVVTLNNNRHAQRTSLLLNNGSVYAGFASCGPDLDPWHGWIAGYNAQDLTKQTAAYTPTADGRAGGIWQSGAGPAGDSLGFIYFNTGNGSNGPNLYSDSVVKMAQPGVTSSAFVPPDFAVLNTKDLDLSSAGPVLIPGSGKLVSGGKEGLVYLLNTNNLATPLQTLQATTSCGNPPSNQCKEIHSLVFWATSASSGQMYVWGDNDSLRAYRYNNSSFNTTPIAQNVSVGSATAVMALSANGTRAGAASLTAILWAMARPSFRAFDANTLAELWDSNQNAARDGISQVAKWGIPTVADGRVYVPTYQKQVLVYGLLAPSPTLTFSPGSWMFGTYPVGQKSKIGHIYATNTGTSSVTFAQVLFTGTNPGDFAFVSNSCHSLAPNQTCKVFFTFTPTAKGTRTANLTFTDNAAGSPQFAALKGIGQ